MSLITPIAPLVPEQAVSPLAPSRGTGNRAPGTGAHRSWAAGSHRDQLAQYPPRLLVSCLSQLDIFSALSCQPGLPLGCHPVYYRTSPAGRERAVGQRTGNEQQGRGQSSTPRSASAQPCPFCSTPNLSCPVSHRPVMPWDKSKQLET